MSGPYSHEPRRGSLMIVERDPLDDVQRARARVGDTRFRYGDGLEPPPRRAAWPERVQDFVRRYGWRAYALPILTAVTVLALVTSTQASSPHRPAAGPAGVAPASASTPPVAPKDISLKGDDKGAVSDAVVKAAALPQGAAYTKAGKGTFHVLPGTMAKVGSGRLFTYTIDVEDGVSGVDLAQYATLVDKTMSDPRSWAGHGIAVRRVGPDQAGQADFHVTLTSAMTVRKICGYDIPVETSCYAAAGTAGLDVNRVVYNVARWVRGSAAYLGDPAAYRVYMINHENGHALGHNHAHQCLPGGLAPVMMQQTIGLRSAATGALCGANPWPFPPGVSGTPGAEQPDTPQNSEYQNGD